MNLRGGCYQRIHRLNRTTTGLITRDQPPPLISNGTVNERNSAFKSDWQLTSKPLIQTTATAARGQTFDPVPQLRERYDAKEYVILVDLLEPVDNTGIWTWLGPLRDDVQARAD